MGRVVEAPARISSRGGKVEGAWSWGGAKLLSPARIPLAVLADVISTCVSSLAWTALSALLAGIVRGSSIFAHLLN